MIYLGASQLLGIEVIRKNAAMTESNPSTVIPIKDWLAIIVSIMLNASAQIFLRSGMKGTKFGTLIAAGDIRMLLAMFFNPNIIGGLLCYVFSILLWMYVLSQQPVGVVYPMMSMAYVAVVLMGWLLLGESLSGLRFVGLAFILIGVWFIARSAA